FRVAGTDLSLVELDSLVDAASDVTAFVDQYKALQERNLVKPAFERLDAFTQVIPLASMPSLIRALSDLSDTFPDPVPGGFIDFDVLTYAWRIIYFGLGRETDSGKRFKILRDALQASPGLLLAVEITGNEERTEYREQRGHQFLLDEQGLIDLKE